MSITRVNALKYVGIVKRVMISKTRIQALKMDNISLKLKPAWQTGDAFISFLSELTYQLGIV